MTNTVLDLERNWLVRPLEAEDVRRSYFYIFFVTLGKYHLAEAGAMGVRTVIVE